jgi:hypothetical protein
MKSPIRSEFEVVVEVAAVHLTHTPTHAETSFPRNQETGALLESYSTENHTPPGDFGDYIERDVVNMARQIAAERIAGGAQRH